MTRRADIEIAVADVPPAVTLAVADALREDAAKDLRAGGFNFVLKAEAAIAAYRWASGEVAR